jgi:hypothetical protein
MKSAPLSLLLAIGLGLAVTAVDFFASKGDISPPATLMVLLVAGAILGWLVAQPWIGAIVLGLILPTAHLVAHAAGYNDNVSPNTYGARLLIAPLTTVVALFGAWVGRALRPKGRADFTGGA